eukprot:TRINITY_DN6168_c0_g1_i2.p1 TRINITY_DN6168_c0_g1~~TRINITY_DN6168_c0_g1_i2.p1  ORF type:complete len:134 (+),score=18.70 TRINITY_DN6168_c0_g1_i2:77-478(+)
MARGDVSCWLDHQLINEERYRSRWTLGEDFGRREQQRIADTVTHQMEGQKDTVTHQMEGQKADSRQEEGRSTTPSASGKSSKLSGRSSSYSRTTRSPTSTGCYFLGRTNGKQRLSQAGQISLNDIINRGGGGH